MTNNKAEYGNPQSVRILEDDLLDENTPTIPSSGGTGRQLAEARNKLNLSVADVAQTLKLTERVVIHMENNEFDQLYGKAYATGYVRSYATLVKLNPDELIQNDPHLGIVKVTTYKLTDGYKSSHVHSSLSWISIIVRTLLIASLIGAAYFSWTRWDEFSVWWSERVKSEKIQEIQESTPEESETKQLRSPKSTTNLRFLELAGKLICKPRMDCLEVVATLSEFYNSY